MTFFWLTVLESVKWAAVWFGLNAHLQDTEPRFHLIESPLITLLGSKTKLSDRIEGIKYSPVLHSEPQFFIEMTTNVHKTTLDQYVWPPLHRPQFTKQTLKVVLQSTGGNMLYIIDAGLLTFSPGRSQLQRNTLLWLYHKTLTGLLKEVYVSTQIVCPHKVVRPAARRHDYSQYEWNSAVTKKQQWLQWHKSIKKKTEK